MTLRTHIWLDATVTALNAQNIPAYVCHRGDSDRGMVTVVCDYLNGTAVAYMQERDFTTGALGWRCVHDMPISTADMGDWVARQRNMDSDMWVLDVETPTDDVVGQVVSILNNAL